MNDELGNRMKEQYEDRTRFCLPRRTYTILRIDGKAFHSYTRGLEKPFDQGLMDDMDGTIIHMMSILQGVRFAYTQSDEVSFLLTDFESPQTDAWFNGNIQKICSVGASLMTSRFNLLRKIRQVQEWKQRHPEMDYMDMMGVIGQDNCAEFDARVFTIPDRIEVMNYFIWRNQDCARNSVSMVAQANFSHKELQGKSCNEMQEMLWQHRQINWANYNPARKNGRLIKPVIETKKVELPKTKAQLKIEEETGILEAPQTIYAPRRSWQAVPAWKFTEDKDTLMRMIPPMPEYVYPTGKTGDEIAREIARNRQP